MPRNRNSCYIWGWLADVDDPGANKFARNTDRDVSSSFFANSKTPSERGGNARKIIRMAIKQARGNLGTTTCTMHVHHSTTAPRAQAPRHHGNESAQDGAKAA